MSLNKLLAEFISKIVQMRRVGGKAKRSMDV